MDPILTIQGFYPWHFLEPRKSCQLLPGWGIGIQVIHPKNNCWNYSCPKLTLLNSTASEKKNKPSKTGVERVDVFFFRFFHLTFVRFHISFCEGVSHKARIAFPTDQQRSATVDRTSRTLPGVLFILCVSDGRICWKDWGKFSTLGHAWKISDWEKTSTNFKVPSLVLNTGMSQSRFGFGGAWVYPPSSVCENLWL